MLFCGSQLRGQRRPRRWRNLTLSQGSEPSERPLARLPLLFAIQQFAEGLVWVGIANEQSALTLPFSYVFAFFALFLCPIYLPLAVFRVEPNARRRRIQEALLVVGLCAAVFISGSLVRHPLDTHLLEAHVCYHMRLPLLYESLGLSFLAVSGTPIGNGASSERACVGWEASTPSPRYIARGVRVSSCVFRTSPEGAWSPRRGLVVRNVRIGGGETGP